MFKTVAELCLLLTFCPINFWFEDQPEKRYVKFALTGGDTGDVLRDNNN